MDVLALVVCGEGVHGQCLHVMEVPALAHKIVASKGLLGGVFVWLWVLTHGSGLGIVVCRVGIQIQQVLGCIFADAQVPD